MFDSFTLTHKPIGDTLRRLSHLKDSRLLSSICPGLRVEALSWYMTRSHSLYDIIISTLVSPIWTKSNLHPSLCAKDSGPGRQCLRSVRRPLGVRVRMPRQSLSVILRGWHPLVTNQAEKSAIAAYWEAASQSVPGSWCHPRASPFQGSLPRCQCIGRRPADCHCYLDTFHNFTSNSLHAQATH